LVQHFTLQPAQTILTLQLERNGDLPIHI